MGLYVIPIIESNDRLLRLAQVCNWLGFINFLYSCVPLGNKLRIYSAPIIANKNAFKFLLIVEKNIFPPGLRSFEHVFIIEFEAPQTRRKDILFNN